MIEEPKVKRVAVHVRVDEKTIKDFTFAAKKEGLRVSSWLRRLGLMECARVRKEVRS